LGNRVARSGSPNTSGFLKKFQATTTSRQFIQSLQEVHMGRRAELLADRIEQGASSLAAFAEKLSDAEWNMPMSLGNDRRSVGTIVHHVATVYPVEVDLARAITGGKAVPNVTWDDVAVMNARHANEVAGITKAAALELLRKNSREAAAAVRAFTDEELDRAAPLSLTYGAPVTAQFVIEDHALRHSWHHLWRIRATLEQASQAAKATRARAS
jgi:DinB superfamily